MSKILSHEVRLASRPKGMPTAANFALVQTEPEPLQDEQVLVRNLYISVDPYMRGRMNEGKSYLPPFELGEPLEGGAVGKVVESRAREFKQAPRPVELDLREQDLRSVIDDVLTLARDELSTRNITLVSQMPSNPMVANVDADLFKQAVLNVILNGAQAMPGGGRLEVTLEEDRKTGVLRIADEGTGIPDDIREKIFDLYFTTKSDGSGIGLAMTYRILQLHHGSIEVQSKTGRGSEFRLRIPLSAADRGRRYLQPASVEIEKGLAG